MLDPVQPWEFENGLLQWWKRLMGNLNAVVIRIIIACIFIVNFLSVNCWHNWQSLLNIHRYTYNSVRMMLPGRWTHTNIISSAKGSPKQGGLGACSPRKFWKLGSGKCYFRLFPKDLFQLINVKETAVVSCLFYPSLQFSTSYNTNWGFSSKGQDVAKSVTTSSS